VPVEAARTWGHIRECKIELARARRNNIRSAHDCMIDAEPRMPMRVSGVPLCERRPPTKCEASCSSVLGGAADLEDSRAPVREAVNRLP
jgi:hypothetical protein